VLTSEREGSCAADDAHDTSIADTNAGRGQGSTSRMHNQADQQPKVKPVNECRCPKRRWNSFFFLHLVEQNLVGSKAPQRTARLRKDPRRVGGEQP